jgi:6-phosphogluconate dehydrogenase (decarboxylating)
MAEPNLLIVLPTCLKFRVPNTAASALLISALLRKPSIVADPAQSVVAQSIESTAPKRLAMRIGFLGLGAMGTPMALRLLAAGHELSVWNRSEERVKPLVHEGAIAAGTPAETELGADAVVTMLADDAAYEEVFFGVYRLIDVLSPGVVHILCGTISVALAERLAVEHSTRGIDFVGVRVVGSPGEAREGQLRIFAAGTDSAIGRARPLLATLVREIAVVGKEPQQAYAMRPEADAPSTPPLTSGS